MEDNMFQSTEFSQRENNCKKIIPQTSRLSFSKSTYFDKIFHCNTISISYCCTKSMGSIIPSHSKQVLQPNNKNYGYNCRKKERRPLDNKCLIPNNIYEAQVANNTNDEHKKYLDAAKTSFKKRYMKLYEVHGPLNFFWRFKNQGTTFTAEWRISKEIKSKVSPNYCKLCLTEKLYIIKSLDDSNLLDKRSGLVIKCRDQRK